MLRRLAQLLTAERDALAEAAKESEGSKRSKRGAMSVAKFKAIGRMVWNREQGLIQDDIWENQPAG